MNKYLVVDNNWNFQFEPSKNKCRLDELFNDGKLIYSDVITDGEYIIDGVYEVETDLSKEEFLYELGKKTCINHFSDYFFDYYKRNKIAVPEYRPGADWETDFGRFSDVITCAEDFEKIKDSLCYFNDVNPSLFDGAFWVDSD